MNPILYIPIAMSIGIFIVMAAFIIEWTLENRRWKQKNEKNNS
jgi:hypothetical protein